MCHSPGKLPISQAHWDISVFPWPTIVVPADNMDMQDMQIIKICLYFCQEFLLPVQCSRGTHKALHVLQRPELFPSRLLRQHTVALQGQEDIVFGLYFQFLILETNTHNKQRGLQFSMKTINNGPEKTYFRLYGMVEYLVCRTLLFNFIHQTWEISKNRLRIVLTCPLPVQCAAWHFTN